MLVLSRKRDEAIKIGNDIVIKVIQTKSGMVRLGIDAPPHIRVLRAELTEFAPPVTNLVTEKNVTDIVDAEDSISDGESDFCFDTEFAVQVEDQMMCVATD